jgi:hypothetical protein
MTRSLKHTLRHTLGHTLGQAFALGAVALLATATAEAQNGSDYSGPGGAGGGIGASLGLGVPLGRGGALTGGPGGRGLSATFRSTTASLNSGQPQTLSIGGQSVTVPGPALQQVGAVLGGASPANVTALVRSLAAGGVGSGPANALAGALATLGATLGATGGSFAALVDAVNAYNAAVLALPAGQPAPPALLAVRAALGPLAAAA